MKLWLNLIVIISNHLTIKIRAECKIMNYKKITNCRISGKNDLVNFLELGDQYLTGVFPKSVDEKITKGPLGLCWSPSSNLIQLSHSYSTDELYGDNYGYRSGLNQSMIDHLKSKVNFLESLVNIDDQDLVLDIGSNDGTLLNSYSAKKIKKIGIDPSAEKFKLFYDQDIIIVDDFFSKESFNGVSRKKAKIITSIAMFYDLESPASFVEDIYDTLDDNGVWHFEQSYLPAMIRTNSYDTICHEHLEYYSLGVINKLLIKNKMKIVDVVMNSINGGSFAITAVKDDCNKYDNNMIHLDWLLDQEKIAGYDDIDIYIRFAERIEQHKKNLVSLLNKLKNSGKKIIGYGASTKGNVLLQYCGIDTDIVSYIVDVNIEKDGHYTPGTNIPIVKETEKLKLDADYMIVLPWHFKDFILRKETKYLAMGKKLIFPFPYIEII